ncbi:hypothetical protein [Streptomyces sp. NPDC093795]|uniref:hypothetical protein n=1 Tax=Streptomyces sp. NPDC093795 TaxID=3366051 RepID=UPI00382E95B8
MSDNEIHVIPADGQSVEEVAEIFTALAAEQGLESEVHVDGEGVIVPRTLTAPSGLHDFPPKNQQPYTLQGPVQLVGSAGDEPGPDFSLYVVSK